MLIAENKRKAGGEEPQQMGSSMFNSQARPRNDSFQNVKKKDADDDGSDDEYEKKEIRKKRERYHSVREVNSRQRSPKNFGYGKFAKFIII